MSNQDLYVRNTDLGASLWSTAARSVLGGGPAIRTQTGILTSTRVTVVPQNYALVDARGYQISLGPSEVVLAILLNSPSLNFGSYQVTLNPTAGNAVLGGTFLHPTAQPVGAVVPGITFLNAGASGIVFAPNNVSHTTIVSTAAGPWLGVEVTGAVPTAGTFFATLVLLSAVQGSNSAKSN